MIQILDIHSIKQILSPGDIIQISLQMLACINKEITMHNIRTAYLALNIAKKYHMNEKCTIQNLVLLSFFHTLGFFREDHAFNYNPHEVNQPYFSNEKAISSKYMYSSLYLEYMTPLHQDARALSDFTRPYNEELQKIRYQEDYKGIIYLAAQISNFLKEEPYEDLPEDLNDLAPGYFDPKAIKAFHEANKDNILIDTIIKDSHRQILTEYLFTINYSLEETKRLESLLVYFLDFKSTQTMTHAINTSCYSLALGMKLDLDIDQLSELFISAALHDIGKIATPQRILEFPGRLSPEDMGIMRHHVNHSKRILSGLVPFEILYNVYRHHEKLNGKGYPNHISGDELTLIQRILTVADITSALNDSRSYKEEFSKDKTISIMSEMTANGELDSSITKIIIEDYDEIQEYLKIFQAVLSADFSNVLIHYNNYILDIPDSNLQIDDVLDELEEVDELDDLDELEEL